MSKSKTKYRIYNGKIIKEILDKSGIYIYAFLFIAGIVFGAYFIKTTDNPAREKTYEICSMFINNKTGQGMSDNLISSISISILFWGANILLGFSLIGFSLILWVPFLKGVGLGAFSGYMYSAYKISGLGYCALLIYPGAVISAFSLILACFDSCTYSKNAFEKSIRGKGHFEKDETKIYIIRQLIYLAITLCSSVTDSLFSMIFSKLFDF